MPLLSDALSVWELGFRWSGKDPSRLWFRIPLEVRDHFRNLMDAILSGHLPCESLSLEKYSGEEREEALFYIRSWIDDVHDCIAGQVFNRRLLRHAIVDRYDFKLWCERRGIPLPDFWFPAGWKLSYELPEWALLPGYQYELRHWDKDALQEYQDQASQADAENTLPTEAGDTSTQAEEKLRPSQTHRLICQQIASVIWKDEPTRTIASVCRDGLIQKYGGGAFYTEDTVREWIKLVAPAEVRGKRGRPSKKNTPEDE